MYEPTLEQQREIQSDFQKIHIWDRGEGCMMSQSEPLLIFSDDVVQSLPPYYRAEIKHLVNTGRAVITESPGPKEQATE